MIPYNSVHALLFLAYIIHEKAFASVIQVSDNQDQDYVSLSSRALQIPNLAGITLVDKTILGSTTAEFYSPATSTDQADWSIPFTFRGLRLTSAGGFVITITDDQNFNPFTLSAKSLVGFTDSAYISSDKKSILGKAKIPSSGTLFGRVNFPKSVYPDVRIFARVKVVVYYVRDDTVGSIGSSTVSLSNQICVPGSNLIECEGGAAFIPFLPKREWSLYSLESDVKTFGVAALIISTGAVYDTNNAVNFVRGTYRYMINKQKIYDTVTRYSHYLKGASVRMANQFNPNDINTYNKPSVMAKNVNDFSYNDIRLSGTNQKVISQSTLEARLRNMLNNGELKYGYSADSILRTGTSTIVPIHLGPKVQVKTSENQLTCKDLCAYHGTVRTNFRTVHYTVIPYPDDSTCPACIIDNSEKKAVKVMASHEFFEAMAQEALGPNYIPGTSEISDPCSWEAYQDTQYLTDVPYDSTNVALQKMWDFHSGRCVTMA